MYSLYCIKYKFLVCAKLLGNNTVFWFKLIFMSVCIHNLFFVSTGTWFRSAQFTINKASEQIQIHVKKEKNGEKKQMSCRLYIHLRCIVSWVSGSKIQLHCFNYLQSYFFKSVFWITKFDLFCNYQNNTFLDSSLKKLNLKIKNKST